MKSWKLKIFIAQFGINYVFNWMLGYLSALFQLQRLFYWSRFGSALSWLERVGQDIVLITANRVWINPFKFIRNGMSVTCYCYIRDSKTYARARLVKKW
jgi:endonuclease/exonuclease/phosphatase (EEP) superfamily protein YafD